MPTLILQAEDRERRRSCGHARRHRHLRDHHGRAGRRRPAAVQRFRRYRLRHHPGRASTLCPGSTRTPSIHPRLQRQRQPPLDDRVLRRCSPQRCDRRLHHHQGEGPVVRPPQRLQPGQRALSRALDGQPFGPNPTTITAQQCGEPAKAISSLVDFGPFVVGPSGGSGTVLTFVPFARDALSYGYYRPAASGAPVTNLTSAELTTIFSNPDPVNSPTVIGGVPIIGCGIQTSSGTFASWNTAVGVNTTQEDAATAACRGLAHRHLRCDHRSSAGELRHRPHRQGQRRADHRPAGRRSGHRRVLGVELHRPEQRRGHQPDRQRPAGSASPTAPPPSASRTRAPPPRPRVPRSTPRPSTAVTSTTCCPRRSSWRQATCRSRSCSCRTRPAPPSVPAWPAEAFRPTSPPSCAAPAPAGPGDREQVRLPVDQQLRQHHQHRWFPHRHLLIVACSRSVCGLPALRGRGTTADRQHVVVLLDLRLFTTSKNSEL